ncbi:MAG: ribosome-associated translation inhibitor RaiA [Candidatus Krumholzibacteriota bacterium]|nr:ribosome-associated translation inhibitor RaiA [Candidatus Krumholzibacteriota bacterium]
MKLTTTARHFETSVDLLEHIEERFLRLKRYFDHILNVDVIMSVEKFRHIAEVNVHVNGHDFNVKEEAEDMYSSIDKCAKNLERQIKKFKGRLKSSHQKNKNHQKPFSPAEQIIRSDSVGSESGIELMDSISHQVADFTVEEAIISMKNNKTDFLLFNNTESGKLNFVYRRADGNYGVIDTSE